MRTGAARLWIGLPDCRWHLRARLHSCERSCRCARAGFQYLEKGEPQNRSDECETSFADTSLAVNLGTGRGHSVLEVIAAAERATGRPVRRTVVPRRAGDPPILVADAAKAQRVLGWTAKRNLDDIVSSAWAWMQKTATGERQPAASSRTERDTNFVKVKKRA